MLHQLRSDKYLIPCILTLAAGVWLIWLGLQMPRPRGWSSAPGLFPTIIGITLMVMALGLFLEGRKRGAPLLTRRAADRVQGAAAALPSLRMPVAIFALVLFHIFVLLAYLPYEVATAIFLAASLVLNGVRSWTIILSVSLSAALVIGSIFILGLETLLPGSSSLIEDFFYR